MLVYKIKRFCTKKENISKVKRQPSEWEKIIANEATDKQLISKIYKQLYFNKNNFVKGSEKITHRMEVFANTSDKTGAEMIG